jgi:hypothetical protein
MDCNSQLTISATPGEWLQGVPLRAALTCVNYGDILAYTLPRNRHYFAEVLVVTTTADTETQRIARDTDCQLHVTEAFHRRPSGFFKWAALEEGLDNFGRHGWMALLDADVVWPASLPPVPLERGRLYGPGRRVMADLGSLATVGVPPEGEWPQFPLWGRDRGRYRGWAGYTQIFHAADRRCEKLPWHETYWDSAGRADHLFQLRWPGGYKVRLPWEVLHLGPVEKNWRGRVTPRVGGTADTSAIGLGKLSAVESAVGQA